MGKVDQSAGQAGGAEASAKRVLPCICAAVMVIQCQLCRFLTLSFVRFKNPMGQSAASPACTNSANAATGARSRVMLQVTPKTCGVSEMPRLWAKCRTPSVYISVRFSPIAPGVTNL